jgi:hypothetical protein
MAAAGVSDRFEDRTPAGMLTVGATAEAIEPGVPTTSPRGTTLSVSRRSC